MKARECWIQAHEGGVPAVGIFLHALHGIPPGKYLELGLEPDLLEIALEELGDGAGPGLVAREQANRADLRARKEVARFLRGIGVDAPGGVEAGGSGVHGALDRIDVCGEDLLRASLIVEGLHEAASSFECGKRPVLIMIEHRVHRGFALLGAEVERAVLGPGAFR